MTILYIEYTDNGKGATIEKLNSRNGLQNVENRILAIKGTITFDTKSGKGFKSSILFPK
jgi:signal transduction histidine kinase